MVSCQGGLLSGWFLVRVVSYQGGFSSWWSLIRMVSCQGGLLSGWFLVSMVSYHGGLSSEQFLVMVLLSGWSLIRVVSSQCGLSSGLSRIRGDLFSGWSVKLVLVRVISCRGDLSSGVPLTTLTDKFKDEASLMKTKEITLKAQKDQDGLRAWFCFLALLPFRVSWGSFSSSPRHCVGLGCRVFTCEWHTTNCRFRSAVSLTQASP